MIRLTRRVIPALAAFLVFTLSAPALIAQEPTPGPTWSQEDTIRIVQQVQKKLANLSTLGVFDWLTFGIKGKTLILRGFASRPVLKSDAENAVKGIQGIESIDNEIEVLPYSPMDDRIRASVYSRI